MRSKEAAYTNRWDLNRLQDRFPPNLTIITTVLQAAFRSVGKQG